MTDVVRVDLHVHGSDSPDSEMSLEAAVDRLGIVGVQGFALTDHNTVAGHPRLAELRAKYPAYLFIPGVEVSTREGHLLAYGVPECPPVRRPILETIRWVEAHDGVAVLAHPLRWVHGVGRRVAETARVSAIETVNGHTGELGNARTELLAAHRGLAATGGSDAHLPKDVGRAFTEFPGGVRSVADALAQIRAGRTRAGGRSITVSGRLRVSLRSGLLRAARGFRPI